MARDLRRPAGTRVWGRSLTILVALLAAASLPGAGASAARQPSIKDLEKQLGKLNDTAEKATEAFNGGRVHLQRALAAKRKADYNLRLSNRDLKRLRRKVRSIAATQYMSGSSSDATVLMGGGPQQILDRSTLTSQLDRNQAALLAGLTTAQRHSSRWSSDAHTAATNAAKTAAKLRGQKHTAQQAVGKVKVKITELRKEAAARKVADPTKPKPQPAAAKAPSTSSSTPATKGEAAVAAAETQLGKPYVWGADGPDSYDCSGLTMWSYGQVGITIPHYTVDQYNAAKSHPSYSDAEPGDLIFFGSDLHHVGMYVGGGKMIEAPHTGDVVKIADLSAEGWIPQIYGLGRYA